MKVDGVARWLWIVAPVAIMLIFYGAILASIRLMQEIGGVINPQVFFYVPFLSLLPPLALALICYVQRTRGAGAKLVITTEETFARDVGIGLGVAMLCVATFVGSMTLLRWLSFPAPDFTSLSWVHHLFFSTVGAVVPGIAEELYFRGFLMQRFRDLRPMLLILITSLSFASWHVLSPSYLPHTFLIGVILGITYYRTNRLLPVMLAHTLANAAAGMLIVKAYV